MHTSTVTQKGQLVISALLRRTLGFEKRTKVVVIEADDGVEVRDLDARYFEQCAGVLSGEEDATYALFEEHQRVKARENDRSQSPRPARLLRKRRGSQLFADVAADRYRLCGCIINWG